MLQIQIPLILIQISEYGNDRDLLAAMLRRGTIISMHKPLLEVLKGLEWNSARVEFCSLLPEYARVNEQGI